MRSLRLALLTCCLAIPALAQEVPALDPNIKDPAQIRALSRAQAAVQNGTAGSQNMQAAASAQVKTDLQGAQQQNGGTVPATMPPPLPVVSPDRKMTAKEAAGVAAAQKWIDRFQQPHADHWGVLHFTDGRGQVQIVTAVDHVTDVRLSPGENIFLPIANGNSSDWIVHPSMGREGGKPVAHIMIKPTDAGLRTNLVVHTSKRTLSFQLASRQRDYMPLVALDIPEDDDQSATGALALNQAGVTQNACDLTPSAPKDQFKVQGDNVPWRPTDVYWVETPVGTKTCVSFASDIGSTELPALLALGNDGGWFSDATKQIVNVRFMNRRFIVDEALSRFILVSGVDGGQETITVTKKASR
jgi:P-type conjugative transfer protein TrbG